MKRRLSPKIEAHRVRVGQLASTGSDGLNGAFIIPARVVCRTNTTEAMTVISSHGRDWAESPELGEQPWEHVSASWRDRTPTWAEMCLVKGMFFDRHEVVLQFHPSELEYVNHHKFCLHLWRPIGIPIPIPPSYAVGPKQ